MKGATISYRMQLFHRVDKGVRTLSITNHPFKFFAHFRPSQQYRFDCIHDLRSSRRSLSSSSKSNQSMSTTALPAPGSPFHLAIPVHSMSEGLVEGRRSENKWQDYSLWGHQIVCHYVGESYRCTDYYNPVDGDEVPVPHFGIVLPLEVFQALAAKLQSHGVKFIIPPHKRFPGQRGEQWTMFFKFTVQPNLEKRIQELNLAHNCGVLMYSRDKFCINLAKKLRPEFSRFFLSSEVKDCIQLIERFNKNIDNIGIDLVVVDSDPIALKLIEYINNRAKSPEYAGYPIVGTVVIMVEGSSGDPADFLSLLSSAGGALRTVQAPCSSKVAMDTLLELNYNLKTVESVYRDIRLSLAVTQNANSTGYPYIPAFDGHPNAAAADSSAANGEDSDLSEDDGAYQDDQSLGSLAISELEEGTQCSSLLPSEIHRARQAVVSSAGRDNSNEEPLSPAGQRQSLDKSQRLAADKTLLKAVEANHNYKPKQTVAELGAAVLSGVGASPSSGNRPSLSQSRKVSAERMHATTASGMWQLQAAGGTPSAYTTASLLLSPEHRVRSSRHPYGSAQQDQHVTFTESLSPVAGSPDRNHSFSSPASKLGNTRGSMMQADNDIEPFIQKSPPNISVPVTVTGLEQKKVRKHWRVISLANKRNYNANFRKLASLSEHAHHGGARANSPSPVTPKRKTTLTQAPISPINTKETTASTPTIAIEDDRDSRPASPESGIGSPPPTPLSRTRSQRLPGILTPTTQSALQDIGKQFGEFLSGKSSDLFRTANNSAKVVEKVSAKASETALAEIVGRQPQDVQLENIIEIDLTHRKMNRGEKDLLEQALRVEREAELGFEEVVNGLYKRASSKCANCKSPDVHLPKLFLAAFKFRRGDFIGAFKVYDLALISMESRPNEALSTHNHDCFVGFYNRAITLLRLGNDSMALSSLENALYFEPRNVQALNVHSLVLRRMGKYMKAIDVAQSTKQMIKEEQLMKELEEYENKRKGRRSRPNSPMSPSEDLMLFMPRRTSSFGTEEGADGDHRGIPVHVSASFGSSLGLKDRIHVKMKKSTSLATTTANPTSNAALSGDGEGLKTFKMRNGFTDTLFEHLFVRTSELQNALITPPGYRNPEELSIINSYLRLVPLFRGLSDVQVKELASSVEYRVIPSNMPIFSQNTPCDAVVVLVKGTATVSIDGPNMATQNLVVGEMKAGDVFGYIDLLMQQSNSHLIHELETFIQQDDDHKASANNTTATSTTAASPPMGVDDRSRRRAASYDTEGRLSSNAEERETHHARAIEDYRALSPLAFGNCHLSAMSEILLLSSPVFQSTLVHWAEEEFRSRLSTVKACGVFSTWSKHDIVRLARMAQTRSYKAGETILAQKEKPQFLHVVMKGMCKVLKRPNQSEVLERKLVELRAKASRHDFKYLYHHGLRNELSKGDIRPILNGETIPGGASQQVAMDNSDPSLGLTSGPEGSPGVALSRVGSMSSAFANFQATVNVLSYTHVTSSEELRYQLELEIRFLEAEIARVTSQETKLFHVENEHPVPLLQDKTYCDIATLQWPMIFGEVCALQPEEGVSRGAIVADTACLILMIHKTQLQTFKVSSAMLDRLKTRAVLYPDDQVLLDRLTQTDDWAIYKENIMKKIPKDRWPKQASEYDAFVV